MTGLISTAASTRVERFAGRAHRLYLGICLAGAVVLILLHPEARPQAALMACLIVAAGLAMLRTGTPLWSVLILGSTGVFAYAVGSPSLAMTQIVLSLAGVAAALYFSVRHAALAMLACQAAWSLVVLWSSPEQLFEFVDRSLQAFAFAVSGTAVLAVVENRLQALDDAHEEQLSARVAGHLEGERQRALTVAKRLVHDEFIGTLRALADGIPVSDGRVQAAAEAAILQVRKIDRRDRPQTLADWVRQISETSPVQTTVMGTTDHRWLDPLADNVAEAVTTALSEALRNVDRHAGGSGAIVQIISRDEWSELRVIDRGPGSASTIVQGWGMANSIHRAMADIGGTVAVVDNPGGGVTVILGWPVPTGSSSVLLESQRATAEAVGSSQSLAWVMSLPALAGNAYLGVRYSWGDEHMVAQLAVGLTVLLASLLTVHRLARHALSAAQLAAYALLTGIATHVAIALAEPDAVHGYDSWIVAFANIGLVVVAFYCPRPHALAALLPSLAVVVWHVAASSDPWAGMGALLAVTGLPVLAAHFGATLRDVSREVETEERVIAQLYHEAERVRAQDRVEEPLLAFLRTDVLPWLERLDWSSISTADRRHADALSAALRDQLYLPGLLDPALRARIWQSRAAGRQVILQAPEDAAHGAPVLLRLLDRILDLAHLERINLRFADGIRQAAELLVVPPLTEPDLTFVTRTLEGLHWQATSDVVSTRITIRDSSN